MALQTFFNRHGAFLTPGIFDLATAYNTTIMNAANEATGTIGRLFLQAGSGSKTISSSGGKIHWGAGAVTWANAGTNVRVGIQDVDPSTGLPDTTWDVFADLVPGTETVTANAMQTTAMESGSKTINHGDVICVLIQMTTRGGTDSVARRAGPQNRSVYPYGVANTGAGIVKLTATPCFPFVIEFDDGTVGYFNPLWALPGDNPSGTPVAIDSTATPDEVALIFSLPMPATLSAVGFPLLDIADTDDFEVILYSDPLGTPSAVQTLAVDAMLTVNPTAQGWAYFDLTPANLAANTLYGVAIRPTTANPFSYYEFAYGSASNAMKATPLGENWYKGTRTDQTGAFSTTLTTIPNISLWLSAFDDGASGGGGFVGIIGGV